jgi:predicted DNA-binding transcriptional regulator YafY
MSGGNLGAGHRLRRLLAVLAWLARRGRAPLDELATRFGITPHELVADLELAACCGLPPYTPDQLMEVVVDEEEVVAHLGAELARPRRCSAAEGFALAASARAILAVPGADHDGALAGALAKLEAALGGRGRVEVELDEPRHLALVRRALDEGQELEVEYLGAGRDSPTTRRVDPVMLAFSEGAWYLDGYCHNALGMRRFRVDRILEARTTGRGSARHEQVGPSPAEGPVLVPGADALVAELEVDAGGVWVAEAFPVLDTEPGPDGGLLVRVGVVNPDWFAGVLVQLGPHVRAVRPAELADAGRALADAILDRYRPGAASVRTGSVAGERQG